MTSEEAKQALKEGKRVRHKKWVPKTTYIVQIIVDEKGDRYDDILNEKIYQNNDWEIAE